MIVKNRVKHPFLGAWLNKGKNRENTLYGKALTRVRAKIEINTLFGSSLARIRVKIE